MKNPRLRGAGLSRARGRATCRRGVNQCLRRGRGTYIVPAKREKPPVAPPFSNPGRGFAFIGAYHDVAQLRRGIAMRRGCAAGGGGDPSDDCAGGSSSFFVALFDKFSANRVHPMGCSECMAA